MNKVIETEYCEVCEEEKKKKEIIVTVEHQWGEKRIKPVPESKDGQLILRLTGRKTYSDNDIDTLKQLGYTIRTKAETL